MIPFPYFGPYIEGGFGGSLGVVRTRIWGVLSRSGAPVAYHVPFSLGIGLGRRNEHHVAFNYLFHPKQRHMAGGLVVGLSY